jgi:hypothetical protein
MSDTPSPGDVTEPLAHSRATARSILASSAGTSQAKMLNSAGSIRQPSASAEGNSLSFPTGR